MILAYPPIRKVVVLGRVRYRCLVCRSAVDSDHEPGGAACAAIQRFDARFHGDAQ